MIFKPNEVTTALTFRKNKYRKEKKYNNRIISTGKWEVGWPKKEETQRILRIYKGRREKEKKMEGIESLKKSLWKNKSVSLFNCSI